MRAHRRTLAALVVGASLVGASPSARADDPSKAAVLAEAAAARTRQGEQRAAIDLYEEAYAAAPRREYLREIGALYDALALGGDSRDVRLAILYLERAILDEGQTPERAAIEARLARLRGWKSRMRSEPLPPRVTQVPLHVVAYKAENAYDVEVGAARCITPCTLVLPPGPVMLRTSGAGKIEQQLVIPSRAGAVRLQHAESGRFLAGAILVPSGLVVGASLWSLGLVCRDEGCAITNIILWPVLGGTAFLTGLVLLAMGRKDPPADANRVELVGQGRPVAPRLTSIGLAPLPRGAGGGLQLEF